VHYGPGYGYTPFGRTAKLARARILALERRAISLLTQPDAAGFRRLLAETSATICGRRGLSVMLELMPRIAPRTRGVLLAHYASSDLPDSDGTDGVWYVALAYARATGKGAPLGAPRNPVACNAGSAPLAAAMGKKLVRIARATLETELRETDDLKRELESPPFSSELSRLQAVFVTLRLRGALRGCVGQLTPQYPLAEAVVRAARNAALRDGRFAAVTPDQVDTLSVEVTALTPLTPVTSWHEIALGRHGILLRHGRRRAVFLPQVPGEQGWTLQQTLDALSRKAGLPAAAWRTPEASFLVFTGQPFRESAETGPLHARRRESP
jgi:AmmeMemoRadiSam system protein A